MHKRRLDLLGEVLDSLSQNHFLQICRQLIFESGETANEMLNLKLDVLEDIRNVSGQGYNAMSLIHLTK